MDINGKCISIIIPCYNEGNNIRSLFDNIAVFIKDYKHEIIFIDDGSTDHTLTQIRELSLQYATIKYLSFSRNFGHQNALRAGIDFAEGDCVIMMDADLQHPPEIIPELIKKWMEGYDLVYTIRKEDEGISFFKKITSKLFYAVINYASETKIENGTADFRLIDRRIAKLFKENLNEYFLFIRGLSSWVGFKQIGISYKPNSRHSGKTKYSVLKMISFAVNGITSFSSKPLRVATILGIVVSLLSFLYGSYAIFASVVLNKTIPGWTSIILTILFIGGVQMFLLGVIGEYIGKIFFEIKKRPHYILKESSYEGMPGL